MWCEYTDMNLVTEALSDFVFTLEMENSTRRLCQRFFSMWYSEKWNEKSNDYQIIFHQFSISTQKETGFGYNVSTYEYLNSLILISCR